MFSRPIIPGYDSEARRRERQPPMMRLPDALDLEEARHTAEVASLEAKKKRAAEDRAAAEAREKAAADALAMANARWSLVALQAISEGSTAIEKEMVHPSNRKRVLKDMPGTAGPSNRDREEDPTVVRPRLRGWECILLALHGTPCYTDGASMTAAQVKELSVPILEARNLAWRQRAGISNLKNRGFIEKLHGVVKLTPTGKAACDEVFSRG